MNYGVLKDLIDLFGAYASEQKSDAQLSINDFRKWIAASESPQPVIDADWENKLEGRSIESVIASQFVHISRYSKLYFRSVLEGTAFSSQDDVIYMIVLRFHPGITKTELIKKNVHDKPAGIQIINRLIEHGWVHQTESATDKRAKVLALTAKGSKALDNIYTKIRKATTIVSADLTEHEKRQLVQLLSKLNRFHLEVYNKNEPASDVLDSALASIK